MSTDDVQKMNKLIVRTIQNDLIMDNNEELDEMTKKNRTEIRNNIDVMSRR